MATLYTTKGHVIQLDDEKIGVVSGYMWHVTSKGYVATNVEHPSDSSKTTLMSMHRLLMELKFGDRQYVDHKNGDKLDNRLENLRLCNSQQNQRNQRLSKNSTSGFKGVRFVRAKNVWEAGFKCEGKNVYIGQFEEKMAAAHAYNKAAIENFGDFAVLNPVFGFIDMSVNRLSRSSLTTEDVEKIRSSSAPTKILAEEFCVHRSTIKRIKNGELWRFV